ncbi:MAG: hypothetical protein OSB09_08150 [Planctomycetota bacterium]|nr:hypothetical protein [Planctomycetota bacterium]
MTAMKVVVVAACVLLLGFDLARDGAEKIRLKSRVETQQDRLSRLRIDLSTSRSIQQALVFEMVWGDDLVKLEGETFESVAHLEGVRVEQSPGSAVSLSILDHLLAEEEGQQN